MRYSNKPFGKASDMKKNALPLLSGQMRRLSKLWKEETFATKICGTMSAAPRTNAADALPQIDGFHLLRHTEIAGRVYVGFAVFWTKSA